MSYIEQILSFGKENLPDILHYLAKEVEGLAGTREVRLYLEDMREGALLCLYTPEGELERRGARIPIERRDNALVRAYLEARRTARASLEEGNDDVHRAWFAARALSRAAVFPLALSGRTIGVLSVDAPSGHGDVLVPSVRTAVENLLTQAMPVLGAAHRFHQQITLGRSLDRSRKRDAARLLLAGSFKLELALDIASVLIPAPATVPEALRLQRGGYMEILAAVSRDAADIAVYETLERISLLEGKSLLSRLVMQEGPRVVPRPGAPPNLFFGDIMAESFDRWEVFNRLRVKTLLMIPVLDPSGSVICVINYFTRRPHRYTETELNLLRSHAQAVGSGISETGQEPFEIRVLSEIEELLAEDTELTLFLGKVAAMAVELVGADSGSIALVQERDQERWLVVEGEGEGGAEMVGAKSRSWRKAQIPRLRVGGEELPPSERSLTGYVAHTGKPFLCNDTHGEAARGGFYRELVSQVQAELAVPITVGESVIGVINLDSYEKGFFSLEHQRIGLLISRLIGNRIADQIKIAMLTQKVDRLRREVSYKDPAVQSYLVGNIIGKSEASRLLVTRISRLTVPLTNRLLGWDRGKDRDVELGLPTILITGETGCGKEFIFNNLFSLLSERYREVGGRELAVRKTNIAAYSGELTYTELFGHRKGAYTGAATDRQGILEEADGGVVFLDEIGDADGKTQVQLLRFLDSGEFTRLGENRTRRSRVVLVAATNRDLAQEIARGAFREDLYHRLGEIVLAVPALRERREDIPDLAKHFLGRLHATYDPAGPMPQLTDGAASMLTGLSYPGNIRQLVGILQGALFESWGGVVGEAEVARALANFGQAGQSPAMDAGAIYSRLRAGEADFWTLVHRPFSDHTITREVVLEVYRLALAEGGGMRDAARILGAVPAGAEGARALTRFKNFMYKTVGVSRGA